jgi:hypothetical protein
MLDYLRPSVTYLLAQLQYLQIFLRSEWVSIDLRVQEVVPSLTALLPITLYTEDSIEALSYLLPLFSTLVRYDSEQFLIFTLLPLGFCDIRFVSLIPLVLALSIISSGDQLCDILPIRGIETLSLDITLGTI